MLKLPAAIIALMQTFRPLFCELTDFAKYHQVLSRAVWSPRQTSEMLLRLLLYSLDQNLQPLAIVPFIFEETRRHLASLTFCMSEQDPDMVKIPISFLNRLLNTVCYST